MDQHASVAIVTDSGTSLPPDLLERYGVTIVPFDVHLGNHTYRDGVDITPETFFAMLRAQQEPDVSTSVPSVGQFLEVYRKAARWAQAIVSIHIAGAQSGTCDTARLAARESPIPVTVIDTETTAMAEGFVVLEAARAAEAGRSPEEVAEVARSVVPCVDLIALLKDVGYAVRGGRLASAARLLGSLLKIQPLVRVANNKVSLVGQVRRRASGLKQVEARVVHNAGDRPTHVVVHAEEQEEGQRLLESLCSQINCVESYLTPVPVALGAHAGPGAIGVGYYVEGGLVSAEKPGLRERLTALLGED
ncbi:MAG: DegV family protein [Anaerolineae bacterium]